MQTKNLLRHLVTRNSAQGPTIRIGDIEYANFASNDYLGLSGHTDICNAAKKAIDELSFGSGASRLLGGGSILHEKLEIKIARFKETEEALIMNSGYAANTGVIPALCEEGDLIFSDELNHASIIDGCRLSRAKTLIYRHKDPSHLEDLIRKEPGRRRMIVTDSVFSMDGDIAPLSDICGLCRKYEILLYIDDAHGTGVLGQGKGALQEFGLQTEPWILQMGTFSKALGAFGAFVAGQQDAVAWIMNSCRSFIFSTALPSCVIAACDAALDVLENENWRIKTLRDNEVKLRSGLKAMNMEVLGSGTPIVPLETASVEEGLALSEHLFKNQIYAPLIRPPSVRSPRIRITVTALHTKDHLDRLLNCLSKVAVKKSG